MVDKVVEATKLAKSKRPDLLIDGELQVDAALVPEVAKKKCPDSPLQGAANVLIFPDLNAGNIAYKLVQKVGGAEAIGPILVGMKRPVHVLHNGCDVNDIVNITAIAVVDAQEAEATRN